MSPADTHCVEKFVTVVICLGLAAACAGSANAEPSALLRRAATLSGLPARHPVPTTTLAGARYDALLDRALNRQYTRTMQRFDAQLYTQLGLIPRSGSARRSPSSRAWYDPATRKLLLRRTPRPGRKQVLHELVRALVDQNFGLRRLNGLRSRDRDRALAAHAIVDGTAALASGLTARALPETPLERFLQLERGAGLGPGRALAAELRYLGGRAALASALKTFPQTTEQLLHVDKFLERERALRVRLPARADELKLDASATFGELDVRSLLRAFGVPAAAQIAGGWGGARVGLYVSGTGDTTAALVIRWDTVDDGAEWRAAVPRYVAAAFSGLTAGDCPPLDRCWSGASEVAAVTLGATSILASGPAGRRLATALVG
jgi:hypothetical protein